jgi:hypothetical protein
LFFFLLAGTFGHAHFIVCGNSIISSPFHLQLLISIHRYVSFTCRAQRPLGNDRSSILRELHDEEEADLREAHMEQEIQLEEEAQVEVEAHVE